MEEKNLVEEVINTAEATEAEAAEEAVVSEEVAAEESCAADVAADSKDREEALSGLTAGQRRRRAIWDKFTTGLLIALIASPVFILGYIFIWFILNITSR